MTTKLFGEGESCKHGFGFIVFRTLPGGIPGSRDPSRVASTKVGTKKVKIFFSWTLYCWDPLEGLDLVRRFYVVYDIVHNMYTGTTDRKTLMI